MPTVKTGIERAVEFESNGFAEHKYKKYSEAKLIYFGSWKLYTGTVIVKGVWKRFTEVLTNRQSDPERRASWATHLGGK